MRSLVLALALLLASSTAHAEEKRAPAKHHGAAPWIVIAVGASTAAIGVLSFVGAAKANADAAAEARTSGYDPAHLQWLVDGEHAMNWIGAIMTAVGGSAIIGGVVWHFHEGVNVAPLVAPGAAMLSVSARF